MPCCYNRDEPALRERRMRTCRREARRKARLLQTRRDSKPSDFRRFEPDLPHFTSYDAIRCSVAAAAASRTHRASVGMAG